MSRRFWVPRGPHGPGGASDDVPVHIVEPALRAQGLSLQTWTSSFVLASLLHRLDVDFASATAVPLPVLELGAGTGLVGLAAAALWRQPVVLTDLDPIVPGLAANIALNGDVVGPLVRCGGLDWAAPDRLVCADGPTYTAATDKAQVILAADTVYSDEHPELLSATILRWLAPGRSSRVVLTYPMRVAYLDAIRDLWRLLADGGLAPVAEGREEADASEWDDECLCEWSVWRWNGDLDRATADSSSSPSLA